VITALILLRKNLVLRIGAELRATNKEENGDRADSMQMEVSGTTILFKGI